MGSRGRDRRPGGDRPSGRRVEGTQESTEREPRLRPHAFSMNIISLDSGPLSLVTQKRGTVEGDACKKWLAGHLARGACVVVPEIVEYELRRELLRARKAASVRRLDTFIGAETDRFLPLSRRAILDGRGI